MLILRKTEEGKESKEESQKKWLGYYLRKGPRYCHYYFTRFLVWLDGAVLQILVYLHTDIPQSRMKLESGKREGIQVHECISVCLRVCDETG